MNFRQPAGMGPTIIVRQIFDRWTLLVVLGAGVFLCWAAGHTTVFDDEAFSCQRYVMPLGPMVSALYHGVEPDPPLYYILQNGWGRLFGVGPMGLRSLSILLFLTGLVFVRLAGEAWFDRTTGRAAMILCALHPAHLFFGFAARWYSLMFLAVAVLLWRTARLIDGGKRPGRSAVAWAIAAAGVCYTNYFGPVVVVLCWLVGVAHTAKTPQGIRRWLLGGLTALGLVLPWIAPLTRQVTGFAVAEPSWQAFAATAARSGLAILTGNLASIAAWWAWLPMGAFGLGAIVMAVQHWRKVWPIAVVSLGCFAAGVASRTMIDKYVMTFSASACLLAAALLVRGLRIAKPGARRATARVVLGCLALGWAGCAVNLVTHRHWSSLRWLDPFEDVTASLCRKPETGRRPIVVASHPSARYYFARLQADESHPSPEPQAAIGPALSSRKTSRDEWRRAFNAQANRQAPSSSPLLTPAAIRDQLEGPTPPPIIITLETAGFVSRPDWVAIKAVLNRKYTPTDEDRYLKDPDATWKDRLDPGVRHPPWRITVRRWELRK